MLKNSEESTWVHHAPAVFSYWVAFWRASVVAGLSVIALGATGVWWSLATLVERGVDVEVALQAVPHVAVWVAAVGILLALVVLLALYWRYSTGRWAVQHGLLTLHRGRYLKRSWRVPLSAITHLDIREGSLLTRFALVRVRVRFHGGHLLIGEMSADHLDRLTRSLVPAGHSPEAS